MEENLEQTMVSDDDFVIGKGFEIESTEETPPRMPKKRKSKGIVRTLIRVFLILIISGGLAFGVIYAGADYLGIGFGRGSEVTVEIEKGSTVPQIAEKLQEAGAVKIPVLFRLYAKLKHYESGFQYGVYNFNTEAGYAELATLLSTEGAKADSVTVTIKEMSTIDEIAEALESNGVCTADDFIDEVQHGKFSYDFIKDIPEQTVFYRLEGYLFPETYNFYSYDSKECAHLAVETMLKTLDAKLTADLREKINNSGHSLHEIMTMASIVELEAGGDTSEMANVAAVFWNRIKSDQFMKLESSPTKKYPHGSGKYDTYQAIGLPPGPLCSPSIKAIEAAIEPTENFEYYYFVTDAKMKFYYNKTLAEHNNTINRLIKEKNWIGDE